MDRDNTIARLENIAKHAVHTAGEDTFILNLDDGLAIHEAIEALKAQLSQEGTTSDTISKFIDGLEETFAHIREREGGDSVCGLCEYDGAYVGESGDWCNECPGFNRDDCFKLSDETRKKWTDEIIKALPTARPEPQWIPVGEKLPETEDFVLASLSGKYRNTTFEHACEIADYADGEWCIYAYPNMSAEKCAELIEAWMPLPTPCQKGATP